MVGQRVECFSLKADSNVSLTGGKFSQIDGAEILVVHEFGKARVFHNLHTCRHLSQKGVSAAIGARIGLNLVSERVVAHSLTSVGHLLNHGHDFGGVLVERKHEVVVDGRLLVGGQVRVVELRDLVQVGQLTERAKEVVRRNGGLCLKERKPEDLRVLGFEGSAYLFSEVVVHNVLKVDLV